MTITSDDIKLMQPQRLSEEDDGGGQMTGLEVVDGDINNLFEDISRVDRAYGNVSLRKAFLKVDTATTDLYLDAHAILSAQPADPKVSALIFTTENFYDERFEARDKIESFVIPGPTAQFYLRGTQLQGQKTIICFAPEINNVKAPEIGQTLMLQIGTDTGSQQYIKIADVTHSKETFTYGTSNATFVADQWILQLTSELNKNFPADDPTPRPANASKIYTTQQSSSAKYFGSTVLATAITAGATSIRVADVFAPIIPTASSETPVIDQRPGGYISHIVGSSTSTLTLNVTYTNGGTSILPTAIVPGSISVTISGTTYTDKGGVLVNAAEETGLLDGTAIEYYGGEIAWAGSAPGATVALTYKPGVLRQQLPNTARIEIDDTNRNFNYVLSLDPPPSPKTFNASYQYLGKWYELNDDGTGLLVGDGSGQINYATGSVVLTLQAQPDADSVIFYRWTEGSIYTPAAASAFSGNTPVSLTLSKQSIVEGSVTITWESGGIEKTATDEEGVIIGDATGVINYARGTIELTSTTAPDDGWSVDYDFKSSGEKTAIEAVPANNDSSDIVLETEENIAPGSVSFTIRKSIPREIYNDDAVLLSKTFTHELHYVSDNSNGEIINRRTKQTIGTVNYLTGQVVISGSDFLVSRPDLPGGIKTQAVVHSFFDGYSHTQVNTTRYSTFAFREEIIAQDVHVAYRLSADAELSDSETITAISAPWRFALMDEGTIVPGSVILQIGSEIWFDDGEGRLLRNYNTSTGVGTILGTIDYSTTEVVINNYAGRPIIATVTPIACVAGEDWSVVKSTTFRTIAAPLRPNGFNVRADDVETSEQYNAQADNEGTLSGDDITGSVDLRNGIAEIVFPAPVFASTVFYNAVSYKSVPLDPEILGLDPVRLPADGRVPIFRDADILVITHTKKDLIESPDDGLVIDAGRDKLYSAWIEDEEGIQLDPDQYTLDKEAGTATLADPFEAIDADGEPLAGDLFFVHRVDDMALCTEARLNGALQLAQPLYHSFPANETWVASAVYLGDLRGRVKDFGCYTTDPGYGGTGTPSAGQFNLVNYPIAIDNRGSVPERWKIIFTNTTTYRLLGEHRGQVATGSTAADFSPTNPQTGTSFFTIKADGWGAGWATGNTVVFETEAAAAPLWFVRTVLPGQPTVNDDELKIELRGDHN